MLKNPQVKLPLAAFLLILMVFVLTTYLIVRRTGQGLGNGQPAASRLGLEDVVQQLRMEMEDTEKHRLEQGKPAYLELKGVDIELQIVAKSVDKATGKIEYEVVTAQMEHEITKESTHKVTLHLDLAAASVIQSSNVDPSLTADGAQEIP